MPAPNQNMKKAAVAKPPPRLNGKVSAEVLRVTPAIAEDWLGRNSHNRPLRSGRVEQLAGAITRGEWQLNGDAIRWNEDGTALLDGQHRLWAVIEADQPIDTLVVWGMATSAQETMDMGAKRNLRDVLTLRGEKSSTRLGAGLNMLWKRRNGVIRGVANPTVAQAMALLDDEPSIREDVRDVEQVYRRFRASAAVLTSFLHEIRAIDADAADAFMGQLASGVGLEEGSPILALRRWLEQQSLLGVNARQSVPMTYALLIKAWNAYRAGKHVEKLTWRPTGSTPEAFPEPI